MPQAISPDPADLFRRYRPLVGDWSAFLDALARPLPACLWTNTLKSTPGEMAMLLHEAGIAASPLPWHPAAFRLAPGGPPLGQQWWYLAGLGHGQEEVSMLPARLLDPQPGERVLDMCASPGGKSAQMAVAMAGRGTLVANDLTAARMRPLRNTIDRLGLINTCTTMADGGNIPIAAGGFDRILVDAPCGAEGVWRKNHGSAATSGPEQSRNRGRLQLALLRKAVRLCRLGGRIVYSTCTFAPEENEMVVDAILREFGREVLRLVPAAVPGFRCAEGVTSWDGAGLLPELAGTLRIWPHLNDTGGFYIALLEKCGGDEPRRNERLRLTAADDGEWRLPLAERYGLTEPVMAEIAAHRQKSEGLHFIARDLDPAALLAPVASGLFGYRTNMRNPKLTTAGAMFLGRHAGRNVVDLDEGQLAPYLLRQTLALNAGQLQHLDGGMTIVRFRGHGLGTGGVVRETGLLYSLYPKNHGGGPPA